MRRAEGSVVIDTVTVRHAQLSEHGGAAEGTQWTAERLLEVPTKWLPLGRK